MNLTKGRGWQVGGEGAEHKALRTLLHKRFHNDNLWIQCRNELVNLADHLEDGEHHTYTEAPLGADGHLISVFCNGRRSQIVGPIQCRCEVILDGTECPKCERFPFHRSLSGAYCIPDISIVNNQDQVVFIAEIIQGHEIENNALDIYSKSPFLKAMFRFKADKLERFSETQPKIIANRVETYNKFKWKGLHSID